MGARECSLWPIPTARRRAAAWRRPPSRARAAHGAGLAMHPAQRADRRPVRRCGGPRRAARETCRETLSRQPGTIPVSVCGAVRTDTPVVQRRGDQPGVRARRRGALQVGVLADAAGADQLHVRPQGLHAVQGVEVGPCVCADAVERHDDDPVGPPFGVGMAAAGIEQAAVAAVE